MKPPEKKEINDYEHECKNLCCTGCIQEGKNQDIESWHKFINEAPIEETIQKSLGWDNFIAQANSPFVANAIRRMLKGEK